MRLKKGEELYKRGRARMGGLRGVEWGEGCVCGGRGGSGSGVEEPVATSQPLLSRSDAKM